MILAADLDADPYSLIIKLVNYQKEIATLFASLTFFREIIVRDGLRKLFWSRLFKDLELIRSVILSSSKQIIEG